MVCNNIVYIIYLSIVLFVNVMRSYENVLIKQFFLDQLRNGDPSDGVQPTGRVTLA